MKVLRVFLFLLTFAILGLISQFAHAQLICGEDRSACERGVGGSHSGKSSSPAYPSQNSGITVNPAAVPTSNVLGAEILLFKDLDFSIVKGTGRVGAAISPTNTEETFFGPPGFETPPDQLNRRLKVEKFKSQKFNLAAALALYTNHEHGLKRFDLTLGIVAKYNKVSSAVWPGAGVSGVAGPFTFGYASSQDETIFDYGLPGINSLERYRYTSETLSAGVNLDSLALDYSLLHVYTPDAGKFDVTLITASLLLRKWILTVAQRSEDSPRLHFDIPTQTLVTQQVKTDRFIGAQYAVLPTAMVEAFYNYYLLSELSIGTTVFF